MSASVEERAAELAADVGGKVDSREIVDVRGLTPATIEYCLMDIETGAEEWLPYRECQKIGLVISGEPCLAVTI